MSAELLDPVTGSTRGTLASGVPDPGEPTPLPDPGEPTPLPDPGQPTPLPDPGGPFTIPDPGTDPDPTPPSIPRPAM